ncbi:hypothetical protein [Gorillibacterium sp. sgz500922]|uniref:hypothetical protein n=1 Tax=Gorillibacterium sp. sgz500922 TaxID=3446694 RepID=UPI003F66D767
MIDYYITPEEYERAASYGVTARRLEVRIREYAWDKEDAITSPPRQNRYAQWAAAARANGIKYSTFRSRLRYGWDLEKAATEPVIPHDVAARRGSKANQVLSAEMIKQARQNGIYPQLLHWRIKHGWDPERAATEPIMSGRDRGRRSARVLKERYGDINAPIFKK